MDMCYEGVLVMPSSYAVMNEEEMTYVEGGSPVVLEAILAAITIGAAGYGGGYAVGVRMGYRFTKSQYNDVKWPLRATVIRLLGAVSGSIVLLGFENGFYSTAG